MDYEIPAEKRIYVQGLAEEIARGAHVVVNGAVELGAPADVICRRTLEVGADLIVMTTHGRTGLSRVWLGSVADGVVHRATVPVLLIRPSASPHARHAESALFRRILVPLDGSTTSSAIIPFAAKIAKCSGAKLVLLRVVAPVPLYSFDAGVPAYPVAILDPDMTEQVAQDAREELNVMAPQVEKEFGVHLETIVATNQATASTILETAKTSGADLIAMTTHGRGASRLLLGSVTDKVLRGGHLPLLVYRPASAATTTM